MKKLIFYNPIFFIIIFAIGMGLINWLAAKGFVWLAMLVFLLNMAWGAIHIDWERVRKDFKL